MHVISHLSLSAFRVTSLSLSFDNLTKMCLNMDIFDSSYFEFFEHLECVD